MSAALTPRRPYEVSKAIVETARRVNEAILADSVAVPKVELNLLATETETQLDRVGRDIREGKNVLEFSLFIRWVQFSRVLNLVALGNPERSDALRKKIESLIMDCGDAMRGGKIDPKYLESDISEINRKLDRLERLVSERLVPCSPLVEADVLEQEPSPAMGNRAALPLLYSHTV